MFLALNEIKHSRLRYILIGSIMMLMASLVLILSGLANGLAADNASAMMNMKADYLVFQNDSRFTLSRSALPVATLNEIKGVNGVKAAAPIGQLSVTMELANGAKLDTTILAINSDSFLTPKVSEGQGLQPGQNGGGVVIDYTAKKQGVKLGDTLKVLPSGQILKVIGFTSGQRYGHLPVIFMDIPAWQAIKFATPEARQEFPDAVSAFAVQMDSAAANQLKSRGDLEVATRQEAISKLPGYSEESGTLNMILVFLLLISALIMAAFFYVITLQKLNQFGILKVLGAKTRYLAREMLAQVLFITLAGVIVGAALTFLLASVLPANIPFNLEGGLVVFYSAVLVGVALLGTLLSLFKVAKVDPLIAIGRVD
jgi:putative ABC transport system permease protein